MIIEYGQDNKQFKIIDTLEITKSSQEVQYSNLTIDFSKGTIEDLPFYLQEIKIKDDKNNNKIVFTGYLNDYILPELRLTDIYRNLEISLFTPRELTTKKTVTIIRTAKLTEIINQTLAPLFAEGFSLKEFNITDKNVTIKIISRTVEEVLNYLSNKFSLYWNIDENKNITINSIEYQFNKSAKKEINEKNYKTEINGFISLTPTVENSDYANIINVKNARIFYESFSTEGLNITLKNGDRIDFENPLDISLETAERIAGQLTQEGLATAITNLQIDYNTNEQAYIKYGFNTTGEIQPGRNIKDVATDDSTNAKFVLTMDSTFKNLATGVTYKGEGPVTIRGISSQTFLKYANMKLINWYEIQKNKGKIIPSGQIEKILDVENGWFTVEELIDYVRNTFINNDKEVKSIKINTNKINEIEVGDKIIINLEKCLIKENFVVTKINETYEGNNYSFIYELKNTNLPENYINLFRSSLDMEEQESQIETEYVVEYTEEETIQEIYEVKFANTNNHTLNFNL